MSERGGEGGGEEEGWEDEGKARNEGKGREERERKARGKERERKARGKERAWKARGEEEVTGNGIEGDEVYHCASCDGFLYFTAHVNQFLLVGKHHIWMYMYTCIYPPPLPPPPPPPHTHTHTHRHSVSTSSCRKQSTSEMSGERKTRRLHKRRERGY